MTTRPSRVVMRMREGDGPSTTSSRWASMVSQTSSRIIRQALSARSLRRCCLPSWDGRDAERAAQAGGQVGLHGHRLGLGPGVVLADG